MSETVLIRPQGAEDDTVEFEREPFRPAKPSRGLGYHLRQVAGINEVILDWVPEERPRYSRLGAIVINTGLMASLSMLVLLSTVNLPILLCVPVAMVWGYLILSFDGWLVASTHGTLGMARLRIFLPRLMISILMGAVIAEPLLLWIFAPDIRTEINNERTAAIGQYESTLKNCNPLSGAAPTDIAGCTKDFILNIPGSPQTIRQDLTDANAERDKINATIDGINAELGRREDLARRECNGTPGNGLSGRLGQGPNCIRDRGEADRYRASSNLDQHQAELVAINSKIDTLNTRLNTASTTYSDAVSAGIKDKIDKKQKDPQKAGILDEDKALEALASHSAFVMVGSWLLRLLLIVVDCLPVLTKLMSRTTTYDALLSRQLDISGRLHEKYVNEREGRDTGRVNVQIERNEHEVRTQMEEIDEQTRAARADREAGLDEQIEQLAARLRGEM
jgi:hypothetical protein